MAEQCIEAAEILLPVSSVDMNKWAVIACDQHTSDYRYWEEVEKLVGDSPSTLRLTLPEIYLSDRCEERIKSIRKAITQYRQKGIFRKLPKGFVMVERKTKNSPLRRGIVLSVDLEKYSYEQKSNALIRATEATILERIPPRLKIREGAEMEFPHIMLLYEDPKNLVLGPLQNQDDLEKLYDFELNMGGGHVVGKFISDYQPVIDRFSKLEKDGLLFMVGDGNHSLATAKVLWEKIKNNLSRQEQEYNPARFALCEAVNIYDESIAFEAIHRVVKGVDPRDFIAGLSVSGKGQGAIYTAGKKSSLSVPEDVPEAVKSIDAYISKYISEKGGEVDYIHGEEALCALTKERTDCVGICLPKMNKSKLFDAVKRFGSLPRKTFSMGESEEKRYYIEGKEIL